jgi:hypothetical protein
MLIPCRYILSGPASGLFGGALAYALLSIPHIGYLTGASS